MNFKEAANSHMVMNIKIRMHLNGTAELNHQEVRKEDNCTLGKWIYGEGSKYNNLKEYEDLKKVHAEFHQTASDIVLLIDKNQKDEAEKNLDVDSKFRKLSLQIPTLVSKVEEKIKTS